MPIKTGLPSRKKAIKLLKKGKQPKLTPGSEAEKAWLGLERLYQKNDLNEIIARLEKQIPGFSSARKSPATYNLAPILLAVVMLLTVGMVLWTYRAEGTPVESQSWVNHLPAALPQSGLERGFFRINLKQQAIEAYEQGHYQEAITYFEQYLEATPSDQRVRMYYGIALLMEKDYSKAQEALQTAQALMLTPELKPSCSWHLMLADYYQHQYESVVKQLKAIIKQPTHPYRGDALAMLAWM